MKTKLLMLAVACGCTFAGSAIATTKAEYKAAKERCDSLSGVPKDTCQNDAKVKFGMK